MGKGRLGLAITHGARLIDSEPPATITSPHPAERACAAEITACKPDPHSRLTVAPGTVSGSPASSTAIRATLRLSSPAWLAAPQKTSSIDSGSSEGFRSMSLRRACAARSSGLTWANWPPIFPMGVRHASTMKTSTGRLSFPQSCPVCRCIGNKHPRSPAVRGAPSTARSPVASSAGECSSNQSDGFSLAPGRGRGADHRGGPVYRRSASCGDSTHGAGPQPVRPRHGGGDRHLGSGDGSRSCSGATSRGRRRHPRPAGSQSAAQHPAPQPAGTGPCA